jgi:putative NADH-flavin reductase
MYRTRAQAQKRQLDVFRAYGGSVTWTFVSPPMMIAPGERTGTYRNGGDQLLTDASGTSAISAEDFAIAILDEVEQPAHPNARFTVAH